MGVALPVYVRGLGETEVKSEREGSATLMSLLGRDKISGDYCGVMEVQIVD